MLIETFYGGGGLAAGILFAEAWVEILASWWDTGWDDVK